MLEKFINQYPISKTLRFKLIPMGKTYDNFIKKGLLEEDEKRAESYIKVKGYMDRYHKAFIESILSELRITGKSDKESKAQKAFQTYCEIYFSSSRTDADEKEMEEAEKVLRSEIASALTSDEKYKMLSGEKFVSELLPAFLTDDEEKETVEEFDKFTTYFSGFWNNRKNIYTKEEKSTGIAFRCINDNLPKFLDNVKSFKKISKCLPKENLEAANDDFISFCGVNLEDMFTSDYFSFVLSQSGIEKYNEVIGGYSNSDGTKVQGINEYINLYNQKAEKSKRLPLLKPLYKQILSDTESFSFIPEEIEDDNELLSIIDEFYKNISDSIQKINSLFTKINEYDLNGVYISSGIPITDISNAVFGDWSAIRSAWNREYEESHSIKKGKEEAFYEKETNEFKKIKSFSINRLQQLGGDKSISEYYKGVIEECVTDIEAKYDLIKDFLSKPYTESKKLANNDGRINEIKNLLDSIKSLEKILKMFRGSGKEENKDNIFYSEFLPLYDELSTIDVLYNRVRNYLTKKPYSTEKIKLNFENPQFLFGWDRNKERDYRTVLLKKGNCFYLAIMDKSNNRIFEELPEYSGGDFFEKVDYKLLPDPSKMLPKVFFSKKNIDYYNPTKHIISIREKETFKKGLGFNIKDCHDFIDFYKASIEKHPDWRNFGFEFSKTEDYKDISGFFREVSEQGYKISTRKVSKEFIEQNVDSGAIYLFQIYNKDFSPYSHGKENLHTMYFKMIFDEKNLEDVVYKLNGQAEMFYRRASIDEAEKIVHTKNLPIKNKNEDNTKKESVFEYDITKDRRYTKDQFMLHIPITMNFKADGNEYINDSVRYVLSGSEEIHVIGIDRGERNLLYVTVIDEKGHIIEQKSLNIIGNGAGHRVDYNHLLTKRSGEMDSARKGWKTIGSIKELKEGYLSQAIHQICELVVKYDAVIAMEDLNSGFMNSRKKVEKQVYQKFEKMLTDKLNYLVIKDRACNEDGGLLRAYQLTNGASFGNKGRQNGIVFYIPAWLTSKIDPVTGFVNLLHLKYQSVEAAKNIFGKFDDIRYNKGEDQFEFDIDYEKFERCDADYRKNWTVCTNGERIETFRNPEKNNEYDCKTVNLTEAFKQIFKQYNIDFECKLKNQIINQNEQKFFKELIRLLNLTLQMRNSVSNSDIDYLISPVRDAKGKFYDSRDYKDLQNAKMPCDADANGAYNIARKGLWAVREITKAEDISKVNLSISNKEWLKYAQNNE